MPETVADGPEDDPVARARALVPLLVEAAPRIEQARELTPEVLGALHSAGMFRLLLPRSVGGEEVDPAVFVEAVEAIAGGDASAAWCMGQGSGCSMSAAYLDPPVARALFGGRAAVLAWGAGAAGRAVPARGGYRVTGRWQFASGSRHATWLGAHCKIVERDGTPRLDAAGRPAERTALLPRDAAAIEDVWQVVGLRGTGSDSYTVEDLFVAADHTLARDRPEERREPGRLYRFSTTSIYASSFAGVALGIARAMLDAFVALAREKTPREGRGVLRDNAMVQAQVALAEARLQASRGFLLHTLRAIRAGLGERDELTLDQRMTIRLAATYAIHQARETADMAYSEAGATAIFQSNPLQQRFRDIHTVCQQVQGRAAHFETVGAHLLGLSPPLSFV